VPVDWTPQSIPHVILFPSFGTTSCDFDLNLLHSYTVTCARLNDIRVNLGVNCIPCWHTCWLYGHHHSTMPTPLPPSHTSPPSPCRLPLLTLVLLLILQPSKSLFASSQVRYWCVFFAYRRSSHFTDNIASPLSSQTSSVLSCGPVDGCRPWRGSKERRQMWWT